MTENENILHSIANNFAQLAEELERRDSQQRARIDELEARTYHNRETLKSVANVILDNLGN
jgi:hypothetical protein